jgi:formate hydrogenlyase subunit 6/NADH:ubiquinone oxidoreductase subunit I
MQQSKRGANNTYWGNIAEGFSSSLQGLALSFRHLLQARKSRKPDAIWNEHYFDNSTGIVTLQYPHESIAVPDNGRYKLHNEMEDCIVCDKCAEICPVNCIDIEAIKATEEIRKTSDGHSVRLYAARFDIDMAKCCFCGLCTTVCPTECLTMTAEYDFSVSDITAMNFPFSDLTPGQVQEKKALYEQAYAEKQKAKETAAIPEKPGTETPEPPIVKKNTFKPVIKKTQ